MCQENIPHIITLPPAARTANTRLIVLLIQSMYAKLMLHTLKRQKKKRQHFEVGWIVGAAHTRDPSQHMKDLHT